MTANEATTKYKPLKMDKNPKLRQWTGTLAVGETETRTDGAKVTLISVWEIINDALGATYHVVEPNGNSYDGMSTVIKAK